MQPWPIAFTYFPVGKDKPPLRLAVTETRILGPVASDHQPGQLVAGEGFRIATTDRIIELLRLQPAGKREMSGTEFLRGHQPEPGTSLSRI